MEKQKFSKEYLNKQIEDCRQKIVVLQSEIQQNAGVIQHCQWMISSFDFGDEYTTLDKVSANGVNQELKV